MKSSVQRELPFDAAESQTPSMRGNSMRENRETHGAPSPSGGGGRSGKAEPKPDMHAFRRSAEPRELADCHRKNIAGCRTAAPYHACLHLIRHQAMDHYLVDQASQQRLLLRIAKQLRVP